MTERIPENNPENKESSKFLVPEEYFKEIVNNERKNFDVEKIIQESIEHGMKEEDIETAVDLLACISILDEKILPDEKPCSLNLIYGRSREKYIASYCAPKEGDGEEVYYVFMSDIEELSLKDTPGITNFNENNEIDTSEKREKASKELNLLSVAFHEIRHRVQHRKQIAQFNPEHTLAFQDKTYPDFIEFLNLCIEEGKKNPKSKNLAEYKSQPHEYDATVIEEFSVSKLSSGITEKDLIELAQLEPQETPIK